MAVDCGGLAFSIWGSILLGVVLYSYFTTVHDIQTTEWQRSTCHVGGNRITKEKKVRSCDDHGHCTHYYCYTPEVEVKLQGTSEKVWAKEFHEASDEDCWLYKPLAARWLNTERYEEGTVRTCFFDTSDRSHVKFSPTRAPIHWWTWLWYFWQGGLGALLLIIGLAWVFGYLETLGGLMRPCCACFGRSERDDTIPLLGELPRRDCHPATVDVSIALWRAAWFLLVLGIALFGPSQWKGGHPGITGTQNEFDRTWQKWAQGDQEFLDHMVSHCDTLYHWMAIGITTVEGLSLLNCAVRHSVGAIAPTTPIMSWLTFLDMWPNLAEEDHSLSVGQWASYWVPIIAVVARITVMNGLLQWGDNSGGLSSYIADSRNSIVHCCDPAVLYLSVTWIFVNITAYVVTPLFFPFGK